MADPAWPHVTPAFSALGHAFVVRAADRALVRWLTAVFAPFTADVEPAQVYDVEEDRDGRCTVRLADGILCGEVPPAHAVAMLLWHVNQQAVAAGGEAVLLHAAGVAAGDAAIVMPAPQDSGKTTLAAGLVASGFDYLSDEVVALDPVTLAVRPHPKALSIDVGAQPVLAALAPVPERALARWLPSQWQVPADHIRVGSVAARTTVPRLLVSPRFEAGAATQLVPLSRADALLLAADCTFRFGEQGPRDFETLVRLVRRCDCYRLVVGDLADACHVVADLVVSLGAPDEGGKRS